MSTLDDLLSQRRRAPLSDADERRVQIGVKSSRDHQLALLAGEAFDRAGTPQPGDAELVRKIVRQVEGEWSGTFQRQLPGSAARPSPRWSRWAAIPTLIAGVAAASWGGERLLQSLRAPAVASVPAALEPALLPLGPITSGAAASDPDERAAGLALGPQPAAPSTAVQVVPPAPSAAASDAVSEAPAPTRGAVRAEARAARNATRVARSSSPAPVLLRPAGPRASHGGGPVVSGTASPALGVGADDTAHSLFLRANRLRRDDWTAAAALYEQLTRRFADSTEAGVAEMALGKHALDEGHPSQALSWFRAYQQRSNGELKSEALWGEARALESLGEGAAARAVWRRLLSEYPASAYATVARQQLGS